MLSIYLNCSVTVRYLRSLKIIVFGDWRRRSIRKASKSRLPSIQHFSPNIQQFSPFMHEFSPFMCCCPKLLHNIQEFSPKHTGIFSKKKVLTAEMRCGVCEVPDVYVGRPPRPEDLAGPFLAEEACRTKSRSRRHISNLFLQNGDRALPGRMHASRDAPYPWKTVYLAPPVCVWGGSV